MEGASVSMSFTVLVRHCINSSCLTLATSHRTFPSGSMRCACRLSPALHCPAGLCAADGIRRPFPRHRHRCQHLLRRRQEHDICSGQRHRQRRGNRCGHRLHHHRCDRNGFFASSLDIVLRDRGPPEVACLQGGLSRASILCYLACATVEAAHPWSSYGSYGRCLVCRQWNAGVLSGSRRRVSGALSEWRSAQRVPKRLQCASSLAYSVSTHLWCHTAHYMPACRFVPHTELCSAWCLHIAFNPS